MRHNPEYNDDVHQVVMTIESLRMGSGMTVDELCKKAYITVFTYYKWLEGRTSPRLETISAVAELFGCEIVLRKKVKKHAAESLQNVQR